MNCFCLKGKYYYVIESGKSGNLRTDILNQLQRQRPDLEEVNSVDKCDVILVLCPIISRAGTDIDAALKKLNNLSGNFQIKRMSILSENSIHTCIILCLYSKQHPSQQFLWCCITLFTLIKLYQTAAGLYTGWVCLQWTVCSMKTPDCWHAL